MSAVTAKWTNQRPGWFWRYECPTWILAIALYAAWAALAWFHAAIPWWLMLPAAAYVAGLHFSLQHEAIHGWRSCPDWLRTVMVWPPIGLWLPYAIYRRSHTLHHRNGDLTYPGRDTETLYHARADWERYSPAWRGVLMANQTLLGRLAIGSLLRLRKLHIVHHRFPTMPWYEITGFYRAHRAEMQENNGGYVFSGYWPLVRRYLLAPVFTPVHSDA